MEGVPEETFPCLSDGGGGRCDKAGVGYDIKCCDPECQSMGITYQGETGRSGYSRGCEYNQGLRNRRSDSVLWKHCHNVHNGNNEQEFGMRILRNYGRDNLTRKVNEAIRIREGEGIKLNSKAEYRQPKVPRVVIENSTNRN